MIFPKLLPDDPAELEALINTHERAAAPLKDGAQARIHWDDELQKTKTEYAIVYLHGFKASHGEGFPVHEEIARRFGCNLYLARLFDHGLEREKNLQRLTAEELIQSAFDACRIGQQIGEKVIVMGTSTGGTLALEAAANPACPVDIHALVLYSPLFHVYGIQSVLLENSIGRNLLRLMPGKKYELQYDPFSPEEEAIWYPSYQLSAAMELGRLIEHVVAPTTFDTISCPVFMGYYYKNHEQHDRVVSTSAIKRIASVLQNRAEGLPVRLKNFPNAGSHVVCNALLSNAIEEVTDETTVFLNLQAGMPQKRYKSIK